MKRKISLFLCLILLLGCIPITSVYATVNVALGKPAFASSQWDASYSPENVTDGNLNSSWSMGTQPLTGAKAGYEYVAVDLQTMYEITGVIVRSRRNHDGGGERKGWIVQLSNDPEFSDAVNIGSKPEEGSFGSDLEIEMEPSEPYRYVRVVAPNYFVIAEIEVYGERYNPNQKNDYSDLTDLQTKNKVDFLEFLGIVNGVSKKEFGAKMLIRREEAVKLILLAVGIESSTPKAIFKDVPLDDTYNPYIATAYQLRMISQSDLFYPKNYVTTTEFLKILEYSMGYEVKVAALGGYPLGVTALASQLNLLSGVSSVSDEPINKQNAAMVLYNALFTPVFEGVYPNENSVVYKKVKILLSQVYDMNLYYGVVTGNSVTRLVNSNGVSSRSIAVDDIVYANDVGILEDYIGCSIGFVISNKDENTIIYAFKRHTNQEVSVRSKDIVSASKDGLKYLDEDGHVKRVHRFAEDLYVLKNGVAYPQWTFDDFKPQDGYVHLIDNNGDGDYEIAKIYEPKVVVVNSVRTTDELTIGYLNRATMDLGKPTFLRVTRNGKSVGADSISKNDIAYVYVSENRSCVIIDVYSNKKSGVVSQISSDGLSIDQEFHEFSDYYKANPKTLYIGMESSFLLNGFDELVYVMDSRFIEQNDILGVIVAFDRDKGFQAPSFKIFSHKGEFVTIKTAKWLKVDGVRLSYEDVNKLLDENKDYFLRKFAMFSINESGLITDIDTENYFPQSESDSNMKKIDINVSGTEYTAACYIPAANGFYLQQTMLLPFMASSTTFIIPTTGDQISVEREHERYYEVTNASNAFGSLSRITYPVSFYSLGKFGYAQFAVKYVSYTVGDYSSIIPPVDSDGTSTCIVNGVSTIAASDGLYAYKISGYDLSSGKEVALTTISGADYVFEAYKIQQEQSDWLGGSRFISFSRLDNTVIHNYIRKIQDIHIGDVILYKKYGETVSNMELIFAKDTGVETLTSLGSYYCVGSQYPDWPTATHRLTYGKGSVIEDILNVDIYNVNYPEVINYSQIPHLFIISGKRVLKYSAQDLETYIGKYPNVLVYSCNGSANAIILNINE